MIVSYPLIGKNGLIKDQGVVDGQPDSFTDATNVRFRDGMAELIYGYSVMSSGSFPPYYLLNNGDSLDSYWLIAGLNKVSASTGGSGSWIDITRASGGDYAATIDGRWNGGIINGVAIINNGVDPPQSWANPSSAVKLVVLPNWPSGVKCKSIRPHKNYLIALNITKSGPAYYPHMVKWSHPADPGTVPISWDHTDPTKDAGETDLPGSDVLVDGGTLGDYFILYKERSTHYMQFIGGQFIFRFQSLSSESGILTTDCWTELNGSHVTMTSSDIVSISPNGVTSIVNSKMRRWLFQNLDPDTYQRSFIAKQQYFNEVWFCFPMSGSTSCSHAIVWNYRDNVFSVRELPSVSFAASGVADSAYPLSWASDTESWDSDLTNWNSNELTPKLQRVVMASPLSNQILLADSTSLSNGVPINGTLERTGITFGDPNKVKLIKGIRPKFYGVQSVFISAGSHNTPYGPVTWSSEVEYTIGSDYQADLFVSGRYLAFRIRSTNSTWRLERVDFDLEVTSDY